MESVKKWHDYTDFYLGVFSRGGAQIVHIWPRSKPYYCQTTLVNNPNFSGMLVTLPNIEKNNSIYIVTFKGQRSWTPKFDCF